eukprot:TRINITY_DN2632_c0_g1_i1.p1 TRINITY_DN2632_c0_g1~~TRINITY_DN2632_c0_g1_i1.p1  ORF type:complete len:547 (-),score=167.50 TRINITY_DN2632_c0_g1_i1:320-1933(-)
MNSTELGVIDHQMVAEAVAIQDRRNNATEYTEPLKCTDLDLSFKNVFKIQNLDPYIHLKKLKLDNNGIEKIEGLETLKSLEWLDLSFNKIKSIENLESLTNLKTLTFFQNKIQKIEGLDSLKNLELLNIGNNLINDKNEFLNLRSFTHLRLLIAKGNPVESDEQYKSFCLAFLPHLRYLDYVAVATKEMENSRSQFISELDTLQQQEAEENVIMEEEARLAEEREFDEERNILGFREGQLFQYLLAEDEAINTLACLKVVQQLIFELKTYLDNASAQFSDIMLKQFELKQTEKNQYEKTINRLKTMAMEDSQAALAFYEKIKQKLEETKFVEGPNASGLSSLNTQLIEANQTMTKKLISTEMTLHENILQLSSVFEQNYESIVKNSKNNIIILISELTNHFKDVSKTLLQLCLQENDRFTEFLSNFDSDTKIDMEETLMIFLDSTADVLQNSDNKKDIVDSLNIWLTDRNQLQNALAVSHDYRDTKLDEKEKQLLKAEETNFSNLICSITEKEHDRNRQRVKEIYEIFTLYGEVDQY